MSDLVVCDRVWQSCHLAELGGDGGGGGGRAAVWAGKGGGGKEEGTLLYNPRQNGDGEIRGGER